MNRPLLLSVLLGSAALSAACHDHAGAGREPDEYTGCATDENWSTFDDVADVVSDADAPVIVSTASNAVLPATPVELIWASSQTTASSSGGDGDIAATCAQWNTGFATAHLEPVSGTVYDLQIAIDGQVRHRVLTSLRRWKASEALWSTFRGKTIELRLRRMVVLTNARREGPYIATTPTRVEVSL